MRRPFTKKCGVPLARTSSARLMSSSMGFLNLSVLTAACTFLRSRPRTPAARSRSGLSRAGCSSNSLSCAVQNPASPFWARASRREDGGSHRERVERERLVFPDEAHLGSVGLLDLLDGGLRALAERTLEVRELDDGDQRGGGATRGARADRHLPHRGGVLRRRAVGLRGLGFFRWRFVVGARDRGVQLGAWHALFQDRLGLFELLVDDGAK